MTHEERAARRRRIAEAVRSGEQPKAVAAREGVRIDFVSEACRVEGMPVPKAKTGPKINPRSLAIIAEMLNSADNNNQIAIRHGVTRQWVDQLYDRAVEAGIKFPPRGRAAQVALAEQMARDLPSDDDTEETFPDGRNQEAGGPRVRVPATRMPRHRTGRTG